MDVQPLDALLAELKDERPAVLEIIEGLQHDLEQADITAATRKEVEALLAAYQVRDGMTVNLASQLKQARVTVLELLEDGFPELPERIIDQAAFDDLEQNRNSIEKAQAQFTPRGITTAGTSTVGEEEVIP